MKITHDCGSVRSHMPARPDGRQAGSDEGFEAAEMRIAKVAEIRQAILAGRFQVSAEAIADRMIAQASGLLEALSSGRRV